MKLIFALMLCACSFGQQISGGGSGGSGGSSGALVLIEEHTASTSATINFTSCFTSTYDNYKIQIVNAQPATNNVNLLMLVSADGGSNWAGSAYFWAFHYTGGGGEGTHQTASDSSIEISDGLVNASTGSTSRSIMVYSPLSAGLWKQFSFDGINDGIGPNSYAITGFAEWQSATAVNALQFKMSSGNIASGNFRCYGISK